MTPRTSRSPHPSQDPPSPEPPGTADPSAGGASLRELEERASAREAAAVYGRDALIVCDRLVRIYSTDGVEVQALQGLDLLVEQGELMAVVGASGSGKSTLLGILAGLDVPTAGSASVAGCDLLTMDATTRLRYRRDVVGFVWQQTARNLLPYLTAHQNVLLPMQLRGSGPRQTDGTTAHSGSRLGRSFKRHGVKQRRSRADELLSILELDHCRDLRPSQLSGGEQQRAAIAVALANNPSVIFADEPTGELDTATAEPVFAAFRRINEELGTTVVIVTHDATVASEVRRTVAIRDGRTASEVLRRTEVDEHGQELVVANEYATIDRAGRLQLPSDFTDALGIKERVLLELESDHIEVRPDRATDGPTADAANSARRQGT